jgi:hypothetical protein
MGKKRFLSEEELENCSIEQLEELAVLEKDDEQLEDILRARKYKLNRQFEWTPENKARLLHLNDKLMDSFDKLKAEAIAVLQTLQDRVNAKDGFLHDFEIEANVTPYFYEEAEDGERYEKDTGIEEVLMRKWEDWLLDFSVSNIEAFNSVNELYFDKKMNWNIEILTGEFDDSYISFGIHELCTHTTGWSLQDVLKINHLWVELKVIYQHFTDV